MWPGNLLVGRVEGCCEWHLPSVLWGWRWWLDHLGGHGGGGHRPALRAGGVEHGNDLFPGNDVDGRVVLGISSLLLGDAGEDRHGDVWMGLLQSLCVEGHVLRNSLGHHVLRHVLRHHMGWWRWGQVVGHHVWWGWGVKRTLGPHGHWHGHGDEWQAVLKGQRDDNGSADVVVDRNMPETIQTLLDQRKLNEMKLELNT